MKRIYKGKEEEGGSIFSRIDITTHARAQGSLAGD